MADATFGYGFESPSDFGDEFNAIAFVCRQLINQVATMIPVKVLKVTGGGEGQSAGTVDVQPLVSQVDGNGNGTKHGTVPGIPWSRVQAGTNAIIMDPQVGDFGYIVAAHRDITKAITAKDFALPGSRRTHDLADSIYCGNLFGPAPTSYILFDANGHVKVADKEGNVVQTGTSGISLTPASGQPVTVNGALVVTGNLQLNGAIQAQNGSEYAQDISTTGTIFAADVKSGAGATLVTLRGHQHTGNNLPPNPGH